MKVLQQNEIEHVNGGALGLAIGVVGGLIGIYQFGKALGRLMK